MKTLKAVLTIFALASATIITGCASQNPYKNAGYGYEVTPRNQQAQVYVPAQRQVLPTQNNAGLIPAPIYAPVGTRQVVQQRQPQQVYQNYPVQRQMIYNAGYNQQRQQLTPSQKCEVTALRRKNDALADMQATIETESGFFVEGRAKADYREDMTKVKKQYINCMQNARKREIRQQYQDQYQYQQTGYTGYGYQ